MCATISRRRQEHKISPEFATVIMRRPTLLLILLLQHASVAAAPLVDTNESPFAVLRPVGFDEVRWTKGFWGERTKTCQEKSIPAMWDLMETGRYKPFLEHFLIAAGQAEGGHHGAKWNDGDFYKWMEAAIATVAVNHDKQLQAAVDRAIAAIRAAQRNDGYLHTPVLIGQRNGDLNARPFQDRHAFEMYNMGHLITTACLHYRVTGRKNLLHVAEQCADFLEKTFRDPTPQLARHAVCPSHYMGILELYRTTRNRRYLELAEKLVKMRDLVADGGDDNQDRVPLAAQREATGHAVRANYLYAGVADLYAESGDPALLTMLTSVWENMVQKKMYITGACGALYDGASPDGSADQQHITRVHQAYGRNYQLPNITAHNETCANIGNLLWSWRMFLISGESKYTDVLELALYNSILSGVSLSGTEYFYVNPLSVVDPLPISLRWPRTRQPFFTSFCCPPNLLRTIAEASAYAYSKTESALWINLYGASELDTQLLRQRLRIVQRTDYPWDGKIELELEECPREAFALKFRIPEWANRWTIEVNGEDAAAPVDGGYAEIRRNWQSRDVVILRLSMQPMLIEANPLVEELSGQAAVRRGPIVYCLESLDLPEGIKLRDAAVPSDINLQPVVQANFLQGVAVLEGEGLARSTEPWGDQLYRQAKLPTTEPFRLRLIPYYAWSNRGPSEMSVWLPIVNRR